jgi:hypothetical protein
MLKEAKTLLSLIEEYIVLERRLANDEPVLEKKL